ncbi:MAG TPA: hypothetical protein VJB59_05830 [Bdellovibrionota bacterium]|nr:hypothetical protein [Bdellovibrionota bacterium]
MKFAALVLIGMISFVIGLVQAPERAWAGFLVNHFFFMSIAIGGLFFAAIHWLTGAKWSRGIHHLSESFTAYLPIAFLAMIVLYFGSSHLYPWSRPEVVAASPILTAKAAYLNKTFFFARGLGIVAVWLAFSRAMVRNSFHAQDGANRTLSPVFLIFFALSFTVLSFDLLMSLDPFWFSTIFGVYCFSILFNVILASVTLLALYVRRHNSWDIRVDQFHDLGKYLFAFTVFWAYIAFSQFMLIWYANLSEEVGYFVRRLNGGWYTVSAFLVFGKFLVPFLVLMARAAKRSIGVLSAMAVYILLTQWIELLWIVQPGIFENGPVVGFLELGITLGFIGLMGLSVGVFLKSRESLIQAEIASFGTAGGAVIGENARG